MATMKIQFYSVKVRRKIGVPLADVRKLRIERKTKSGSVQVRHALAATVDGMRLMKFVSADDWAAIDAPAE